MQTWLKFMSALGILLAASVVAVASESYWELSPSHGFLPRFKSAAFITPLSQSLKPLLEHDYSKTAEDREKFLTLIQALPSVSGISAQTNEFVRQAEHEDNFHILTMLFANFARISTLVNPELQKLVIPAGISRPLFEVANMLNRMPAVAYPSLVLDNCEWNAQNNTWQSQRLLSGLQEENGFYISHCQQEQALAPAVYATAEIAKCIELSNGDVAQCGSDFIAKRLDTIADAVRQGLTSMKKIYRNVSPSSFFKDVRPYMKYLPRGIVVEFQQAHQDGVSSVFMNADEIAGPTGAQTSSVPFLDALLGVKISDPHLNAMMIRFRQYQPELHRQMLERAESVSPLFRAYIMNTKTLRVQHAFDDALTAISEWRASHVILTNEYIQRQIPGEALGTGKTRFHRYLCQHLQETMNARINPVSSTSVAIPDLCHRALQKSTVENLWQLMMPVMNALAARLDIDLLQ